jgi:hypothetical protein
LFFTVQNGNFRTGDALVVVTDGTDNRSKHEIGDVKKLVIDSGVRVFVVLLNGGEIVPEQHESIVNVRALVEKTGGGLVSIGEVVGGVNRSRFEINAEEKAALPGLGQHVAGWIVNPYLLMLDLPLSARGKVRVKVQDPGGAHDKEVTVVAPEKLSGVGPREGLGQ